MLRYQGREMKSAQNHAMFLSNYQHACWLFWFKLHTHISDHVLRNIVQKHKSLRIHDLRKISRRKLNTRVTSKSICRLKFANSSTLASIPWISMHIIGVWSTSNSKHDICEKHAHLQRDVCIIPIGTVPSLLKLDLTINCWDHRLQIWCSVAISSIKIT